MTRHVVDDHVGHDVSAGGKRGDVVPRAETSIDLRVVDRIEARVGAIDRMEEGKQVEAAEDAGERTVEQVPQISKRSARDAIDVHDQLRLILHPLAGRVSSGPDGGVR